MKPKDQKRTEALERARARIFRAGCPRRYTEEEYLDLFRPKDEKTATRRHAELYPL